MSQLRTPGPDRADAREAAAPPRPFERRIDCAGERAEPRGGRGLGRPLPSHGDAPRPSQQRRGA